MYQKQPEWDDNVNNVEQEEKALDGRTDECRGALFFNQPIGDEGMMKRIKVFQ